MWQYNIIILNLIYVILRISIREKSGQFHVSKIMNMASVLLGNDKS